MFNQQLVATRTAPWVYLFIALLKGQALHAETVLTHLDFESQATPAANGWTFGSQGGGKLGICTNASENMPGSKGSLMANYPIATGGVYAWASFDVKPYNTQDIYIEFDAKMPNATQGIKFFKIFGQARNGEGSNTTFGLTSDAPSPGSLNYIGFGDGTARSNDVNNVILLDGANPSWIGRAYGKAKVYTIGHAWRGSDWQKSWHHFRIHAKFNTNVYNVITDTCISEINDGAYYLEIDNTVYVDASGLYNHHCSNLPIDIVEFFDWGQNGTSPFDVYFDNIRIMTGGFSSTVGASSAVGVSPAVPSNVKDQPLPPKVTSSSHQ